MKYEYICFKDFVTDKYSHLSYEKKSRTVNKSHAFPDLIEQVRDRPGHTARRCIN